MHPSFGFTASSVLVLHRVVINHVFYQLCHIIGQKFLKSLIEEIGV